MIGRRSSLWVVLFIGVAGCKDITRFDTKPGEAYCGAVVQGPFVRTGFGPAVQLRLTFDSANIASSPGNVTTTDGLLNETPLRAIPQVFHDPLSSLDFGEGRQRSLIYVATTNDVASPATVIVSLMESGDVEVRILRGAPDPSGQDPTAPLFGVFPLKLQQGTCF